MSVVTSSDDDPPLNVVLECSRRGDAVVPLLQQHLENELHWEENADESDWWGLLHSLFILGLIPGKASAHALLNAFQRVTCDGNNNLSDWVSGYWPALFRNKTEYTTAPLRQIAESREAGWYARAEATDCVLAAAAPDGVDALEQAVDWLATVSSDTTDDDHFRVIAGQSLLDFPRERYRPLMEALVDLQRAGSPMVRSYDRDDIQKAFDKGDDPEWERFADPWKFYDPDEIERRQTRWAREAGERYEDRPISAQPYKRKAPKTGRNDPCPCGSGKKYKKCCLIAAN